MTIAKIGVFNMTLPAEGPVSVPYNVDMAALTSYDIDMTQAINDKIISFISGAWIDNSLNAHEITLTCFGTNQQVKIGANKQGFMPLLLTNPPKINVSQSALGSEVKFIFVNFPVFPYIF